eukprot:CAMPEP_0115520742 /NCGR_PEP_ID=MMETSP0271-20121206/79158_1 /TAXON_ID=71861 /ORGANISM="Scrippsiella trochoidea, Strain CCMP3099" /LENGTH=35 /DNA_ID= /DNA_START= /DNA_END= /DNA_ORIENTATION=
MAAAVGGSSNEPAVAGVAMLAGIISLKASPPMHKL